MPLPVYIVHYEPEAPCTLQASADTWNAIAVKLLDNAPRAQRYEFDRALDLATGPPEARRITVPLRLGTILLTLANSST